MASSDYVGPYGILVARCIVGLVSNFWLDAVSGLLVFEQNLGPKTKADILCRVHMRESVAIIIHSFA